MSLCRKRGYHSWTDKNGTPEVSSTVESFEEMELEAGCRFCNKEIILKGKWL